MTLQHLSRQYCGGLAHRLPNCRCRSTAPQVFREYVTVVDDQLRHPDRHAPTVGILLCSSGSKEGVVRYALRSANAPMAIATYTYDALSPAEQAALPPVEAITAAFTSTGELTANAQINATGALDHDPDGSKAMRVDPSQQDRAKDTEVSGGE
jgi:hypothetical protein